MADGESAGVKAGVTTPANASSAIELGTAPQTPAAKLWTVRWAPLVGALALCSLALHLTTSDAVQVWLDNAGYLGFVVASWFRAPVAPAMAFDVPVTPMQAITAAVGVLASIGTGIGVARAVRPHAAAAPLGWVTGLLVAVVPAMLVAMLRWPDGGGLLSGWVELAAIVLVAAACMAWTTHAAAKPFRPPGSTPDDPSDGDDGDRAFERWSRWLLPLGGLLAVMVAINGLSAISGYDSFSDHIARPARWFVTGRIEGGAVDEVVTYYPGNFELLVRWTLALGSDRFAFLIAYASGIVAVWLVYRLAREIGLGAGAARLSALAAASLQVLAYQSLVVYSDGFTAVCLLLATWLLLIWIRTGAADRRLTAGFAAALGLALGAKYSAGPPVVVLSAVWLWHACRDASRTGFEQPLFDVRWLLGQVPAYVAGVLPGMLYWYLRNFVEQGNPLYPLSVAGLPGIPIGALLAGAPGPQGLWQRLTYAWVEHEYKMDFETGFGPVVASVVVLALILTPFVSSARQRWTRVLWLVLVLCFAAWVNTGVLVPRYGLFPLLLAFVFVGTLLLRFPSLLLRGTAVVAIALSMLARSFELAGGAAYNLMLFDTRPTVPLALASLPPSRVLSLAGQPASYFAMAPDFRHRVVVPFRGYSPDDVRRASASYLLLPRDREQEFVTTLSLELVDRFERKNALPVSLWRIRR
jgi:hypothetical protein